MLTSFIYLCVFTTTLASYEGHQIWSVSVNIDNAETFGDIVLDQNLKILSKGLDYITILVSSSQSDDLQSELSYEEIPFKITVKDISPLIEEQFENLSSDYDPNNYNSLDDIYLRMDEIAASDPIATIGSIGLSYEGREQRYIRFDGGDQIIWMDCGIHSEEWIAPATCMHGVELFTTRDPRAVNLLQNVTIYILPVYNVDGYEYTHQSNETRLWTKNRNPNEGEECEGVDLNRNFDDHWGLARAPNDSCDHQFRGQSPASEPETQNAQNFWQQLNADGNLIALYSIHSYSQSWMYPYGYARDERVDLDDEMKMEQCSAAGVNALTAVHGTFYRNGRWAIQIYPASGITIDYAYNAIGVTYTYTLELRDLGEYRFELPPEQIQPTGEETWAGFFAAFDCHLNNP